MAGWTLAHLTCTCHNTTWEEIRQTQATPRDELSLEVPLASVPAWSLTP